MSKVMELSDQIIKVIDESDCNLMEVFGALRFSTLFFEHENSMMLHAGCAIKEPENAPS